MHWPSSNAFVWSTTLTGHCTSRMNKQTKPSQLALIHVQYLKFLFSTTAFTWGIASKIAGTKNATQNCILFYFILLWFTVHWYQTRHKWYICTRCKSLAMALTTLGLVSSTIFIIEALYQTGFMAFHTFISQGVRLSFGILPYACCPPKVRKTLPIQIPETSKIIILNNTWPDSHNSS